MDSVSKHARVSVSATFIVLLFSLAGIQVEGVFYLLGLYPLITFLCRKLMADFFLFSFFQMHTGKVGYRAAGLVPADFGAHMLQPIQNDSTCS